MKIVVKVGTSTLAHATGRLNIRHVEELVKVLSDLKNAGHHDLGQVQHDEGIHAHSQCIAQVALHLEHEPGRAQDVAGGIAQHQTHGGDHRLAAVLSEAVRKAVDAVMENMDQEGPA